MPRVRWQNGLNPPDNYQEHADAIRSLLGDSLTPDRSIEILYGVGPVVEVTVTAESTEFGAVARFAEEMVGDDHTGGAGRTTFWYTPEERQELKQGSRAS